MVLLADKSEIITKSTTVAWESLKLEKRRPRKFCEGSVRQVYILEDIVFRENRSANYLDGRVEIE